MDQISKNVSSPKDKGWRIWWNYDSLMRQVLVSKLNKTLLREGPRQKWLDQVNRYKLGR